MFADNVLICLKTDEIKPVITHICQHIFLEA